MCNLKYGKKSNVSHSPCLTPCPFLSFSLLLFFSPQLLIISFKVLFSSWPFLTSHIFYFALCVPDSFTKLNDTMVLQSCWKSLAGRKDIVTKENHCTSKFGVFFVVVFFSARKRIFSNWRCSKISEISENLSDTIFEVPFVLHCFLSDSVGFTILFLFQTYFVQTYPRT